MDARTITLDGYRHRYYASVVPDTTLPPIVALHGFGLDGQRSFRSVASLLRDHGCSLYALDLLGFGGSATPDRVYSLELYATLVAEFAALQDGDPLPILVGHSMGGKIAAATAILQPAASSGLVLVNPGGFSWMAPWLPPMASARSVNRLLQSSWIQRHVLPHLPMGRFLAQPGPIQQALRLRNSHYALDLDATGLRPQLRDIALPTAVLWGQRDLLLPPSTLDRLRADLPQARVHRLPASGHIPMWDAPAAVALRLSRFAHCIGYNHKQKAGRPEDPPARVGNTGT